jgi:hypothetical protein
MSQDSDSQRIIHLAFAAALGEYLERVRDLGAVEGRHGSVELNPTLRPVVDALHHVLAGGEVEVRVLREGQADIVRDLQQRVALATSETNALNQQSEPPVVTAV